MVDQAESRRQDRAAGGEDHAPPEPPRKRVRASRVLLWTGGVFLGLLVILLIAPFFLDEPLRRITEKKVNQDLKGYSVQLPGLHLQLLGLSLTLKRLTIRQQAHPEPPVAYFPVMTGSIHWRALLSGKLVGELKVDSPKLHINQLQLKAEASSKVSMKQRGWQQALEDIYPLKINHVDITDASITYIDQDPKRPLELSHLNLQATNIRNVNLPDKVYPSTFHLDTDIFHAGHGVVDGRANFLAEPYAGLKGSFKLEKIPLDSFKPVIARSNIVFRGGMLRATGEVEYAPKVKIAQLKEANIHGMSIDYIHSPETAGAERRRAEAVKKGARTVSNQPGLLIRADDLSLTGCTLGMENREPGKSYRLYLADTDLHLSNFSNQFSQGTAKARLSGRFMGSGVTSATADFRPEKQGPDFDLYLKIDKTQLTSLNDLLRAYGKFDVAAGLFSLVTELHIRNNVISGYIKPFFQDMKVYDRRKDKEKGMFHKLYEILVGGVAKLLENRPHQAVATKADISGLVQNPRTSTWQIIGELIKNAFFKAILPTFERDVTATGKR